MNVIKYLLVVTIATGCTDDRSPSTIKQTRSLADRALAEDALVLAASSQPHGIRVELIEDAIPAATVVAPEQCPTMASDDGVCSVACDPTAVAQHVPIGTCVTFACTALDGTLVVVGGCR